MRNALIALVLVAPLAATGCKKKDAEPTVQAPPPVATAPAWSWGIAQYSGSHAAGEVGQLTYNLNVLNGTDKGLIISSWDLGTATDTGRVCVARGDTLQKANAGQAIDLALAADCEYAKLPEADSVTIKGTITFALSGVETVQAVETTVVYKQN